MERALILLGHGSRDPLWRQPMDAVAARALALEPLVQVRCAFLEMEPPSLVDSVAEVVAAGARHVTVLPMFLGTGRHAREDLPLLVEQVRAAHPDVAFDVRPSVGEQEPVIDLLARLALG